MAVCLMGEKTLQYLSTPEVGSSMALDREEWLTFESSQGSKEPGVKEQNSGAPG